MCITRSKPIDSPIEENHKLAFAEGPLIADATQYRRPIGHLIYLTITLSELSCIFHVLSQFMRCPRIEQFNAAKCVLRYLKGDPSLGHLLHAGATLEVYAHCDSDWALALLPDDL